LAWKSNNRRKYLNFTAEEIRPNIYHLSFGNKYYLTSSMMRLEGYYESPSQEIRGKYFSFEKFMDIYASDTPHKNFSYFTDWSGMNIPGKQFLSFYDTFKYDLWLKEADVLNIIMLFRHDMLDGEDRDNFYVIATYKGKDELSLVNHELSHAYWHLHTEAYANPIKDLLKDPKVIKPSVVSSTRKALLNRGYCEDVLDDELQAYYATSSKKYMVEKFKYPQSERLPSIFKKTFENFDRIQEKELNGKVLKYSI
jgi:hypothetical protein